MDTADSPQHGHPLARLSTTGALGRPPVPMGPPQFKNAAPPPSGPTINARTIWRAVLRHWWQALTLWVIGTAALGAAVWIKYKPEYQARGLLKIELSKTDLFNMTRQADDNYMSTQVQLITSPNVLLATAADSEVKTLPTIRAAKDAETTLRQMIKVVVPNQSYLIEVSATSEERNEPAVIVNSVMKNYMLSDKEWANGQTSPLIESLEKYRDQLQVEITEYQTRLQEHAKKGQVDLELLTRGVIPDAEGAESKGNSNSEPSKYSVSIGTFAKLKNDLLDLDLEIAEAEGLLEVERQKVAAYDPELYLDKIVERMFLEDPDVANVADQIRTVDSQLVEHARRIKKSSDPTLAGLRARLDGLRHHYEKLWEQKKEGLRAQAQANAQSPDAALIAAKQKLNQLEIVKQARKDALNELEIDRRQLSQDTVTASLDNAQFNHLVGLRRSIDQQLRQLRFDQQAGGRIIEIAKARSVDVPILNKRTRMLALVPLGVLGLVVGLCTLLEMRAGRVGSPDELSARVPVEVFAVPPLPVVRPSRSLKASRSNDSQFELFVQQLDHLRVALCGEATSHPGRGRCVLITSATGGEGKTTLAAQLAVRCAEAGTSTVLIDADLRRATLGRLFEVPECPGLSDVLRGEANLEDALVAISQVGGCQLLPAGSNEPNPNRILRGQRFGPMIEQLRRTFDVIIIDTSPVLPVPDALIMGRYTDGVVLAARHDRSRFPLVERANHLLTSAGIPVLGVVINGVQPTGMKYGDYAYSSYRSERGPASTDDGAARSRVG
jgi:polysaccharide biosynthesis transport protein